MPTRAKLETTRLRRLASVLCVALWGFVSLSAVSAQVATSEAEAALQAANTIRVDVQLPKDAADQPLSGRLFLFTTQQGGQPMQGPNWFSPEPFYGMDVQDWEPGSNQSIDDSADHFPAPISQLPPGKYQVQALFDHDFYSPSPASGVGNFYSEATEIEIKEDDSLVLELELDQVVPEPEWPDSEWVKFVEYRSELLSDFHGREVIDRVAVVLPASYYDHPERRYPTFYQISGFGGSLRGMSRRAAREPQPAPEGEAEFIRILLTGECKWGHHVYADSATNGPRGQSTIEELIPLIDDKFRTVADPRARYVGGHSSGGWSSLWLQVRYPETFGGVWSTSPDPVDFRDYQQSNLYADPPESIYYFADGQKKPLARRGENPIVWYPDFAKMDDCLKRGGQLRSFEAVFSPRGPDGEPLKMWDRETGQVNPEVVEAWMDYDISLRLKSNWTQLQPLLEGKLHITMGDLDTFYLEGATVLLKQVLEDLGSDAQVTIIPGANHGSYLGDPEFRQTQTQQMSAQYFRYFDVEGEPKE